MRYFFSFETGQLSISQRRGIVKLIPKKDAELVLIKNWRPLTLLRTFARKFSNIDFFLKILPLKDDELVMPEMYKKLGVTITDFVLERTYPKEHLNLRKSGFVSEEGQGGCKSQNIAIRALEGNVLHQIWFKWAY